MWNLEKKQKQMNKHTKAETTCKYRKQTGGYQREKGGEGKKDGKNGWRGVGGLVFQSENQ